MITTEWLESVGCSVKHIKDPFSGEMVLKAFDAAGNPYAYWRFGSWSAYAWIFKPRFRVKTISEGKQ